MPLTPSTMAAYRQPDRLQQGFRERSIRLYACCTKTFSRSAAKHCFLFYQLFCLSYKPPITLIFIYLMNKKYMRFLLALFFRLHTLCMIQKQNQPLQFFTIDRVICPFPIFFCFYKPAIAKYFHMMRKCRLRNVELLQYFTGAKLPVLQHFENFKSCAFSQCFQYFDIFHMFTSHRQLSILYALKSVLSTNYYKYFYGQNSGLNTDASK